MIVTPSTWVITIVVLGVVLAIDVLVIGRRPHVPSMKECGLMVGVFVAFAVVFGCGVWLTSGPRYAGEFFAGWLTEYSLSVDNLFIFLIIMEKMKVPRHLQQFALLVGIILALLFRGVFIGLGAAAIQRWAWIFFVFGLFLIYTAIDLVEDFVHKDAEREATDNLLIRQFKQRFQASSEFVGTKLLIKVDSRRLVTPMLLVIVALGSTDLLFALDSIPAIYGLTQQPYLVFAVTVFALMGLRQLYFMLGGLLSRLLYLQLGLSVVLAFIAIKLILHAMHHYGWDERFLHINGEIPIWASLVVIMVSLAATTVVSVAKGRRDARAGGASEEADGLG